MDLHFPNRKHVRNNQKHGVPESINGVRPGRSSGEYTYDKARYRPAEYPDHLLFALASVMVRANGSEPRFRHHILGFRMIYLM